MNTKTYLYLHKPEEFDRRFEQKRIKADTYEQAYLEVEKEYRSTFGESKYSNYESYRKCYQDRLKRKMKKKKEKE